MVLVLGSQNSSNSQRLAELARETGGRAYLIDGAADIEPEWFTGDETVLVTAGAMRPETVVEECLDFLARSVSAPRSRRASSARKTSTSRCRANCAARDGDGR